MNRNHDEHQEMISEIYEKYLGEVRLYFIKYTRDEMRAEDMAQDLFIRLMTYKEMILKDTAKSFVFTTARRMIIDDARHQDFVRRATECYLRKQEESRFWQDCETLECKQIKEMELAKLRSLPPRMAEIYRMSRFEEKTADEMATELNISKRTVESHLLTSRREIRSAIRKALAV